MARRFSTPPVLFHTHDMPSVTIVGRFLLQRWRNRVREVGVAAVARQLRKQGVPLSVARVILFGKP